MDTWRLDFVELNYNNLHQYTDLPVEKLKRFTMMQIADCVRVHVLRDNGGVWLDADTIVLDGLPSETVLGDPDTRTNTIGFLRTEANTDMFNEWASYQDRIINGNDTSVLWSLMGNDFTDGYLKEHHDISMGNIVDRWPETYMVQGNMPRLEKYRTFYFKDNRHLADIRHTDLLMLHNSWTPEWYKQLSKEEVLKQDCTLSNILNEIHHHGWW